MQGNRFVAKKNQASLVRVGRHALGRGVFARVEFRRGDVIGEVTGRIIEDDGYGSDYCMDLAEGVVLEPHAPFRYLNHSCAPNCELFTWDEDDPKSCDRLWVQALRRIKPGDELTIDYAWPAEGAIPCSCLSELCRGWIVSKEEAHRVPRD